MQRLFHILSENDELYREWERLVVAYQRLVVAYQPSRRAGRGWNSGETFSGFAGVSLGGGQGCSSGPYCRWSFVPRSSAWPRTVMEQ